MREKCFFLWGSLRILFLFLSSPERVHGKVSGEPGDLCSFRWQKRSDHYINAYPDGLQAVIRRAIRRPINNQYICVLSWNISWSKVLKALGKTWWKGVQHSSKQCCSLLWYHTQKDTSAVTDSQIPVFKLQPCSQTPWVLWVITLLGTTQSLGEPCLLMALIRFYILQAIAAPLCLVLGGSYETHCEPFRVRIWESESPASDGCNFLGFCNSWRCEQCQSSLFLKKLY